MISFNNKKILVNGGTRSSGKELVRHLLRNGQPEAVRVFDADEIKQFELQQELKGYEDPAPFHLEDARDTDWLNRAAEDTDIISYITVLKHVIACEYSPFEAVMCVFTSLELSKERTAS